MDDYQSSNVNLISELRADHEKQADKIGVIEAKFVDVEDGLKRSVQFVRDDIAVQRAGVLEALDKKKEEIEKTNAEQNAKFRAMWTKSSSS